MDRQASNFYLDRHLAQTNPHGLGIQVEKAEGIYIYDKNGRRYVDLVAGLAVSALGHGNPAIKKALNDQIDRYLHVMVYGEMEQDPQLQLAKLLSDNLPDSLDTCYFVNSGTEANEAALKLAKRVTGRNKIVSFMGAYHGSTHGSLSVSGNEKRKTAFRPLLPGISFIELNRVEQLNKIDHHTACVILETIQADAGIRIPTLDYMKALRMRCDEVGALLILDEIQVGMGRTGTLWAFEQFNIVPDILTLGKALGAGLPIGAFISSKEKMSTLTENPKLGHITTFGGHPLITAGAYAGLKHLIESGLIHANVQKGELLSNKLRNHPLVKDVRYRGLLFAIELESASLVQQIVERCLELNLITFWFLSCPSAFRLAPPYIITKEELTECADIVLSVLDELNLKQP